MILRNQEGAERSDVVCVQRDGDIEVLRELCDTAVLHFPLKDKLSKIELHVVDRGASSAGALSPV